MNSIFLKSGMLFLNESQPHNLRTDDLNWLLQYPSLSYPTRIRRRSGRLVLVLAVADQIWSCWCLFSSWDFLCVARPWPGIVFIQPCAISFFRIKSLFPRPVQPRWFFLLCSQSCLRSPFSVLGFLPAPEELTPISVFFLSFVFLDSVFPAAEVFSVVWSARA
jgi:hypothetical protein